MGKLCCRGLCRWHPFGLEAEDDGHNRVKHIRVQHGDQLLSVILFSCILYAASGEILQNSPWQHGEIYAAGAFYAVGPLYNEIEQLIKK